eukprot:scaffold1828_cov169-Amphora_coffeaeformis.AAC.22
MKGLCRNYWRHFLLSHVKYVQLGSLNDLYYLYEEASFLQNIGPEPQDCVDSIQRCPTGASQVNRSEALAVAFCQHGREVFQGKFGAIQRELVVR